MNYFDQNYETDEHLVMTLHTEEGDILLAPMTQCEVAKYCSRNLGVFADVYLEASGAWVGSTEI